MYSTVTDLQEDYFTTKVEVYIENLVDILPRPEFPKYYSTLSSSTKHSYTKPPTSPAYSTNQHYNQYRESAKPLQGNYYSEDSRSGTPVHSGEFFESYLSTGSEAQRNYYSRAYYSRKHYEHYDLDNWELCGASSEEEEEEVPGDAGAEDVASAPTDTNDETSTGSTESGNTLLTQEPIDPLTVQVLSTLEYNTEERFNRYRTAITIAIGNRGCTCLKCLNFIDAQELEFGVFAVALEPVENPTCKLVASEVTGSYNTPLVEASTVGGNTEEVERESCGFKCTCSTCEAIRECTQHTFTSEVPEQQQKLCTSCHHNRVVEYQRRVLAVHTEAEVQDPAYVKRPRKEFIDALPNWKRRKISQ
jgi:hypothetical protein